MGFCVAERPVSAGDEGVQALERESEMGAALVVGDGVDLVDDDGADSAEVFPALAGGKEDVERFWSGDEDVRRVAEHGGTLFGQGVAGADAGADLRAEETALHGEVLDLGQGGVKVFLDVVGESLERADVDDLGTGRELAGERGAEELVDADEEGGEGFAGASGRGDEGGVAPENAGPAVSLRLGGAAEFREEPLGRDGMRPGERWGNFKRHALIVARFCSLFVRRLQ
jgi:hypothetical protein